MGLGGWGIRGPKGRYARGEAPSLEPAFVMPEGHHPSKVAKSGPIGQTRGDHP